MFVTANQIFIFLACVSFGGVAGVLFSSAIAVKSVIKNKWLKILPDVFAFFITAILYVLYSFNMRFSNLRLYMVVGVLVGISLYLKSFHILLAKFLKKAYNIIKTKRMKAEDDRRKVKKTYSRDNGRRSIADSNTVFGHAVRNNKNK
ncbi:MAG: spore cortex biosynthesis protein YabQ [Clostridia bacterium]|nr:spore cortex biosynthesis protein YabQ [Clostridia bacterium]